MHVKLPIVRIVICTYNLYLVWYIDSLMSAELGFTPQYENFRGAPLAERPLETSISIDGDVYSQYYLSVLTPESYPNSQHNSIMFDISRPNGTTPRNAQLATVNQSLNGIDHIEPIVLPQGRVNNAVPFADRSVIDLFRHYPSDLETDEALRSNANHPKLYTYQNRALERLQLVRKLLDTSLENNPVTESKDAEQDHPTIEILIAASQIVVPSLRDTLAGNDAKLFVVGIDFAQWRR